jgi:hypothetical protein
MAFVFFLQLCLIPTSAHGTNQRLSMFIFEEYFLYTIQNKVWFIGHVVSGENIFF